MDRDLALKSEPFYSVQWEPNEYRKDPEEIVGSESRHRTSEIKDSGWSSVTDLGFTRGKSPLVSILVYFERTLQCTGITVPLL